MSEPLRVVDNRSTAQDAARAKLLDDVEAYIRRYVYMTDAQYVALTMWVAHTYAIDAADCTPYIHISSEGPRAGKTRSLEVLELVVRNPLRTADITEAAMFHLLSHKTMTLLLDEIDTVFGGGKKREGLRALLNASYRRGTLVRRVRGGTVESYEVFGPKIIAGIGNIPDTIADRSIPIKMERKREHHVVERFYHRDVMEIAGPLTDRLSALFGNSYNNLGFITHLKECRPERMEILNDRQNDSWESLVCLADYVGGGWGERVRKAAFELHNEVGR